jgi:hypothetical protein
LNDYSSLLEKKEKIVFYPSSRCINELSNKKLKIRGAAQTLRKIFRSELCPKVFTKSEEKWKSIPTMRPYNIFRTFFLILSLLIDNEQPNKTIEMRINGNEKR